LPGAELEEEQVGLGLEVSADVWLLGIGGVGGDDRWRHVRCRKGVGLSWRELCCWWSRRGRMLLSVSAAERKSRKKCLDLCY
jgi:hypothetical protein